jgi:dienelactone hydrolase
MDVNPREAEMAASNRTDPMRAALAVEGLAAMFLTVREGSPWWQAFRGGCVLLAVIGCLLVDSRACWAGRATVAFLAGVLGTTIGIGIGVGHLLASSRTAVTVSGLACLAAGITLLGCAVVATGAHARRRIRLVAVLGLGTLAFALVFPSWPAVYATNVPRPPLGSATPRQYDIAFRDVAFPTPDGVRLAGWYVPSRTGAAVVLLHGAGSTRDDVLGHADVLARHGIGVLLADARGHGGSGGRAMDFGWYGDADVAGAVAFLERQPEVNPTRIGAVGLSMGGEEAIGAAAADPRIRAVVAEGATARIAADLAWYPDRYGWRGAITKVWKDVLTFRLADVLTDAHPPVSLRSAVAQAAPRPVLLITAGTEAEEAAAATYIRSGAPSSVTVWNVPAAGHTRGLATQPGEWERRVVGFLLESWDRPPPGAAAAGQAR